MSIMQIVFNKNGYTGLLRLDTTISRVTALLYSLSVVSLVFLVNSPWYGWVPAVVLGYLAITIEQYRIRMWHRLDLRIKIPYVILKPTERNEG